MTQPPPPPPPPFTYAEGMGKPIAHCQAYLPNTSICRRPAAGIALTLHDWYYEYRCLRHSPTGAFPPDLNAPEQRWIPQMFATDFAMLDEFAATVIPPFAAPRQNASQHALAPPYSAL